MSEPLRTHTRQLVGRIFPQVESTPEVCAADYRALCRRGGGLLRTGGLVAFVGILESNRGRSPAHSRLLSHLRSEWVEQGLLPVTDQALSAVAAAASDTDYIALYRATLAFLRWQKRFSESLIAPSQSRPSPSGQKKAAPARRNHRHLGTTFASRDNPSLAINKLVPTISPEKPSEREGWLQSLIEGAPSAETCATHRAVLNRYKRTLTDLPDVRPVSVVTSSRLLVGLGDKGPMEFGLSLHPLFGTPLIPGSSLKGAAAAHAREVGGPDWQLSGAQAARLFGTAEHAGVIDILDAWWEPTEYEQPFELEIINPHYTSYLAGNGCLPDGMESPVPFKFLAVRAGTHFWFALRGGTEAHRVAAEHLLRHTLSEAGVGAKTTLGYGRFASSSAT